MSEQKVVVANKHNDEIPQHQASDESTSGQPLRDLQAEPRLQTEDHDVAGGQTERERQSGQGGDHKKAIDANAVSERGVHKDSEHQTNVSRDRLQGHRPQASDERKDLDQPHSKNYDQVQRLPHRHHQTSSHDNSQHGLHNDQPPCSDVTREAVIEPHASDRAQNRELQNKQPKKVMNFGRGLDEFSKLITSDPLASENKNGISQNWPQFDRMIKQMVQKDMSLEKNLKLCFKCNLVFRQNHDLIKDNEKNDLLSLEDFWGKLARDTKDSDRKDSSSKDPGSEPLDLQESQAEERLQRLLIFQSTVSKAQDQGILPKTAVGYLPLLFRGPYSPNSVHKCGEFKPKSKPTPPTTKLPGWFDESTVQIYTILNSAASSKVLCRLNKDRVSLFLENLRKGISQPNSAKEIFKMEDNSSMSLVDTQRQQTNIITPSTKFYQVSNKAIKQALSDIAKDTAIYKQVRKSMFDFGLLSDGCHLVLTLSLIRNWDDLPIRLQNWLTATEDEPLQQEIYQPPRHKTPNPPRFPKLLSPRSPAEHGSHDHTRYSESHTATFGYLEEAKDATCDFTISRIEPEDAKSPEAIEYISDTELDELLNDDPLGLIRSKHHPASISLSKPPQHPLVNPQSRFNSISRVDTLDTLPTNKFPTHDLFPTKHESTRVPNPAKVPFSTGFSPLRSQPSRDPTPVKAPPARDSTPAKPQATRDNAPTKPQPSRDHTPVKTSLNHDITPTKPRPSPDLTLVNALISGNLTPSKMPVSQAALPTKSYPGAVASKSEAKSTTPATPKADKTPKVAKTRKSSKKEADPAPNTGTYLAKRDLLPSQIQASQSEQPKLKQLLSSKQPDANSPSEKLYQTRFWQETDRASPNPRYPKP